jgi:hypothetical protein
MIAVYLLTRTRDVGGDDTVFALSVETWLRGQGANETFFATAHPIYNPLVAGLTWLVRLVRPGFLVLDAGAALSALGGGLIAGGLVMLLRRHGLDGWLALLSAIVIGLSGGVWSFAIRMEVYTLAAAALTLWLGAVTATRQRAAVTGLALALGVLSHLALAVLVLPTAWCLRDDLRSLARTLLLGLGIPVTSLIAVFVGVRGVSDPAGWIGLLMPGESIGYLHAGGGWAVIAALERLVLWQWYRAVPILEPSAAAWMDRAGLLALALAGSLVVAGAAARFRPGATAVLRTTIVALAAFLPLWLVWDPGNVEHLVASSPLFGILIGVGASRLPRLAGRCVLASLALLLLLVNGALGALPQSRPENGRLWVLAGFLSTYVGPEDTVLAVGMDPEVRLGLGYVSGRKIVHLTLAARSASLAGEAPQAALCSWLDRARGAQQLWVLGDVFDESAEAYVTDLGIDRESWRRVVAGFDPQATRTLEPDEIVVRSPFRIHRVARLGRTRQATSCGSNDRAPRRPAAGLPEPVPPRRGGSLNPRVPGAKPGLAVPPHGHGFSFDLSFP